MSQGASGAKLDASAPIPLFVPRIASNHLRRLVDIAVSLLALAFLSPFILVVAAAIKVDSPGPVLTREKRAGRRLIEGQGSPLSRMQIFGMYRFRTTYTPNPRVVRLLDDKQITRTGRFLQKTSLDELPQFINVLKGEMSLIGPRPIAVEALEGDYDPAYEQRFDIKPGITGLWQVSRSNIGTLREMAMMDIAYIKNRSLRVDTQILLMSFGAIIQRSSLQHWIEKSVATVRENVIYNIIKRVLDLMIAVPLLISLLPVLLIISVLIRLDSAGPVVFSQVRAGKRMVRVANGKVSLVPSNFKIYKFRTMYHSPKMNDAAHKQWVRDWVSGKLNPSQNTDEVVKPQHDPRITRIGRFLRASSLDELPQLINVIKGEMSLVGPRPVPVYEVEAYKDKHYGRLDAIPGMTGWWQVNLRGRGTLDQMVELDMEYVYKRSLWMDIKIMVLTIPAVFNCRGAK